ncbi:hypothetical protein BKA61DRAFT_350738 [Leptodontidium sp. MPI-SDFR-AT-0119]|nr:hypothetical protein BKA61DRAFT_350738 [Leptodontidium sp. MPI-SDFR-AT-0119]
MSSSKISSAHSLCRYGFLIGESRLFQALSTEPACLPKRRGLQTMHCLVCIFVLERSRFAYHSYFYQKILRENPSHFEGWCRIYVILLYLPVPRFDYFCFQFTNPSCMLLLLHSTSMPINFLPSFYRRAQSCREACSSEVQKSVKHCAVRAHRNPNNAKASTCGVGA